MPSQEYGTLSFTKEEIEEWKSAMALANDIEMRPFGSLAEFVRDALRRRMDQINLKRAIKKAGFVPITDSRLQGMNDG